MQEMQTLHTAHWTYRQRTPADPGLHPLVLMLHGWTGDEESMWIFASRLPKKALLVAPRALFPTPLGGFGWHDHQLGLWPTLNDLRPAVLLLQEFLTPANFPTTDLELIHLVGFSQGAALSIAFSLIFPHQVASLAVLSGFLPEQIQQAVQHKPLAGKPVFVTHGTRDELVPVEKARQAVTALKDAGADVVYCEDDVGHKLSLGCFSSLEQFSAYAVI